ncbi:MAG: iron ABC transporter permease [Bacteroidales bacterium]|nr:iron ABC transporter permease [Bacteroidales bacterium]
MNKRTHICFAALSAALLVLFVLALLLGPVAIPAGEVWAALLGKGDPLWATIVLQSRLPQAVTALLAGAALAVSGLLLQTLFSNPLAGPSILGVSDGANLGVAVVMLSVGAGAGLGFWLTTVLAAMAGSAVVLGLIVAFARRVKSSTMLLIIGIMIGYIASSLISILNFHAAADQVHRYVMWGMGDFSSVTMDRLPYFCSFVLLALAASLLLVKPLDALLLGEAYAANLGVNVQRTRVWIMLCTGLMTAAVTAFCGPISFIGLAVPHIARLMLGSSNHHNLLPVTLLAGACLALLCSILTCLPGTSSVLPLNAVTPLFGAPVIIYVIMNRRKIHYFN